MDSAEIRQKFFDFFTQRKHEKVSSSSLIPAQDPTLLFANAGMNQFKDVFLGKEKRSYTRAVSIQKCVRAGGKHNDLDNVGFTKRHLTFFEMMGNFSFGDYFKKEAIEYAWNFLTTDLQLPKDRLHASVFREDDEAYNIWHTVIGLPQERIVRLGEADNFWQMGDTGPCGPCSEIYIDQGKEIGCKKKDCGPGCSCDRFLEIWNLVFMQYDRQPDGTDKPLKQTGVDTGMGLERLCAVVQKKDSVFLTDLFEPLLKKTEQLTGLDYKKQDEKVKAAFHVLADHIRSSSLIIADGGSPSNEGRGYVLRKIIRRAALFAQKLSNKNIFPELVDPLADKLGSIYPELEINREKIKKILTSEIEKFSANLVRGQAILETYFAESKNKSISGEQTFKLYDTFGFPLELTRIIAGERGFDVDIAGFEKEMEKQREQSGKKQAKSQGELELPADLVTQFTGYQETETTSPIRALIVDNELVDAVPAGTECWVITQRSPFYVECGGQVSDQGFITIAGKQAKVLDLKKFNHAIGAKISAPGEMKVGMSAVQVVDRQLRLNTMKNHTATHLLQAALIQIFGKQIKQSGSLVEPDYLRFDFTYHENLSAEDIKKVEDVVNAKVQENIPVSVTLSTHKAATDRGVIAFFGEKYNPEEVRVIEVPGFSAELCGGTHVRATGDIGCFKITEVSALSAGNRRIFAVTGPKAVELFQENYGLVKKLSQEFKVQPHEVLSAINKQKDQLKVLQAEVKQLKKQAFETQVPTWLSQTEMVGKIPFLFLELPEASGEELKELATHLQKQKPGFYFLISSTDAKSSFMAALSQEFAAMVNLKNFQAWLQENLGIRGGGSAQSLQGGGPRLEKSWQEKIKQWLKSQT
jgi:alanyl-tRNA synthetase